MREGFVGLHDVRQLETIGQGSKVAPSSPPWRGDAAKIRSELENAKKHGLGHFENRLYEEVPQVGACTAALLDSRGVADYRWLATLVLYLERQSSVEPAQDLKEVRWESKLLQHQPEDLVVDGVLCALSIDVQNPGGLSVLLPCSYGQVSYVERVETSAALLKCTL